MIKYFGSIYLHSGRCFCGFCVSDYAEEQVVAACCVNLLSYNTAIAMCVKLMCKAKQNIPIAYYKYKFKLEQIG